MPVLHWLRNGIRECIRGVGVGAGEEEVTTHFSGVGGRAPPPLCSYCYPRELQEVVAFYPDLTAADLVLPLHTHTHTHYYFCTTHPSIQEAVI